MNRLRGDSVGEDMAGERRGSAGEKKCPTGRGAFI